MKPSPCFRVINPTYLSHLTETSPDWQTAKQRVVYSYRQWLRAAPEIQTMYALNFPVARLRTKMRQEFERHRFVNKLPVVDMLLFQSRAEFQEVMNFWKQISHIMKYFKETESPDANIPQNFMQGFLEGRN